MADDNDDWFASLDEEPVPEPVAPTAKAAAQKGAAPDKAAAEGQAADAAGAEAEAPPEPAPEEEYLDPDKLLLFKHWIRPKFLQYDYLYNYQYNYYDNVLDYLEKRSKGYLVERPSPQTWAERALRTYMKRDNQNYKFRRTLEDTKLVTKTQLSGFFHSHHARQSFKKSLIN